MNILAGAEPIFYQGNRIGCLCLHGFMASPNEVKWLGEFLAQQGYTVYCPLIAGHGTHPQDVIDLTWNDYYTSVVEGYTRLSQTCDQIFVCGLSMGGMLALLLASEYPVTGVGVLAAPLHFPRRMRFAAWVKYVQPYQPAPTPPKMTALVKAEQLRRGEPTVGRVRYEDWPMAAIDQLYQLSFAVRGALPKVTAPLLMIYSEKDDVVPLQNCDLIAQQVRSTHLEKHILTQSGHILTQDIERETVFELVGKFIQQF